MDVKVAVTERSALIDGLQVDVPEHAPLQPTKDAPVAGVLERETRVSEVKDFEHVPVFPVEQEIPAGFEVTVPLPTIETERMQSRSVGQVEPPPPVAT